MTQPILPAWLLQLEEQELTFIRNFILSSGSLKDISAQYNVSYPTVRLRLDRLIQKIRMCEDNADDNYVAMIKRLALDDKLDFDTAKLLIQAYRNIGK